VGGIVRDALLKRYTPHQDLDFVLPVGAVETAKAIARHYNAGFVLLDADRQIARVVFERATADFAAQVGDTLEVDLQRRDFTVNAIAYNPHTDKLIDPLQGYADIQQGLLKMISISNLQEDPLRLLRAYRQAAQLGFRLDPETQSTICQLAPLLGGIAAERVQSELSYLLSTPKGTPWLRAAWQDGLLKAWFPHASDRSLSQIAYIDRAIEGLRTSYPEFVPYLHQQIREKAKTTATKGEALLSLASRRTWLTVAKLACLVADSPQAEAELQRLKYSRAEIQAVLVTLRFLPLASVAGAGMTRREQYGFFQEVGAAFPAIVLLALAAGDDPREKTGEPIAPLIDRFLTPDDPVAHPTPLLSGKDLMAALQIPPSPRVGQLLAEIQLSIAEGKISTKAEALQLARELSDLI